MNTLFSAHRTPETPAEKIVKNSVALWHVPVSKSIVFKDTRLSLGEKRHLMRLMQAIQGGTPAQSERARDRERKRLEAFQEKPFTAYLADAKAPEKLIEMLVYPLAQAVYSQGAATAPAATLTTREAVVLQNHPPSDFPSFLGFFVNLSAGNTGETAADAAGVVGAVWARPLSMPRLGYIRNTAGVHAPLRCPRGHVGPIFYE